MITSSDDPEAGRKSQRRAPNSTKPAELLIGARRRLARLFDLDERELIDLQVMREAGELSFD